MNKFIFLQLPDTKNVFLTKKLEKKKGREGEIMG